jgi:hypothetical protein|tara:strand:+ start:1319 stop:1615 length:297 start_codon:yes stop_codon:yes gene_type:complete
MRYKSNNNIKTSKQGKRYYVTKLLPSIDVDDTDLFVNRVDGVNLGSLAKQYYDDENLWWVIARANGIGKKGYAIDSTIDVVRIPSPSRLNEIIKDYEY